MRIDYRNFLDEDKTFLVDRRTLRVKRDHITAVAAPAGRRIALAKGRIRNLSEVERHIRSIGAGPSAREKQVLGYHRKNRSTSPLYESIKRKYPGL